MSNTFIGKIENYDFNKIIEDISYNQKEILNELEKKFNTFDSEKRKNKLKMLSILWITYLSTVGTIENEEITKEDLDLIKSLFDKQNNNNFIPLMTKLQNSMPKNNKNNNINNYGVAKENELRLEKKKSGLKENSRNFLKEKDEPDLDTCKICYEEYDKNEIINPQIGCNNYFHGKCFVRYIEEQLNNNYFPIRCPFCENDNKHDINYKIIQDCLLLNDKDSLCIKLENISLNYLAQTNSDDITYCPTAGCSYMCFYDRNEYQLNCPLCKKSYCLQCKSEWHMGMTCQEFQSEKKGKENDIKFEEYVKGNNNKQCPNCKRWVEKISGCNHISCPCGSHFCYSCGKLYDGFVHNCQNNINQAGLFRYNNQNQLGLFGNNNNQQSLFGNNNNNQQSLFGNNNNQQSLFGNNNNNNQQSLFGNNNKQQSLFGNNNNQQSLFSNNNKQSLFGNNNKQSLFGNNNQQSLFGNNNNQQSIFINNNNEQSLFGNNNNQQSLFSNNNNQQSLFINNNNQQNLFINNNNQQSLFINHNNEQSLFANNNNQQSLIGNNNYKQRNNNNNNKQSLFVNNNNNKPSLFINNNNIQSLFGNNNNQPSLFGNN